MKPLAYSVAEVAEMLSFEPGKSGRAGEFRVRRLIDTGQLRAVRVGRSVRVPDTEITRLLAGERVAS